MDVWLVAASLFVERARASRNRPDPGKLPAIFYAMGGIACSVLLREIEMDLEITEKGSQPKQLRGHRRSNDGCLAAVRNVV